MVISFNLQEFNLRRKKLKTVAKLRTPQNIRLIYREGQILLSLVNAVFGFLLVPSQTLVTQFVIFVTAVLVWVVTMSCVWMFILEIAGYIYILHTCMHGNRVLTSWMYHQWGSRQETRFMNKFTKSCKSVMIHYGNANIIRGSTLLSYIRGLLKGIF